jgi:hypothetical protein
MIPRLCKYPDCESYTENENVNYCASHGAQIRKEERESLKEKKKPKPIKRESEKRKGQNKEYSKLRKEYLALYPVCEVFECHNRSEEIHHIWGRTNENLIDVNGFLAVCPECHKRITEDSAWAISQGYSILRTTI